MRIADPPGIEYGRPVNEGNSRYYAVFNRSGDRIGTVMKRPEASHRYSSGGRRHIVGTSYPFRWRYFCGEVSHRSVSGCGFDTRAEAAAALVDEVEP